MIKDPKDNPEDNSQDEKFLSRWSRRKQEIERAQPAAADTVVEDAPPQIPLNTILPGDTKGRMVTRVEADRITEQNPDQAPALTDEDMPPIESLAEDSDFTGFMSPGVSEKLRKLALRKLFAGAGFNIRDGLDDYDEDFTNFEPLGDIITCDMKHQQEMAEKRKQEEAERLAAEQQAEQQAADEIEQQTAEQAEQTEQLSAEQETAELEQIQDADDAENHDQRALPDDAEVVETDDDPKPEKIT